VKARQLKRRELRHYILGALLCSLIAAPVFAHHILGRPSYNLDEESNTPPSMQVETQIGQFYVTYQVFPAFPQPGQPGRINLYASRIADGKPFDGVVRFSARDDRWFAPPSEPLGEQPIDDGVYRQGFVFKQTGDYIVSAHFDYDHEPYDIDFPLTVGKPFPVGPIGFFVGAITLLLVGVNVVQRRRLLRDKIRAEHAGLRS